MKCRSITQTAGCEAQKRKVSACRKTRFMDQVYVGFLTYRGYRLPILPDAPLQRFYALFGAGTQMEDGTSGANGGITFEGEASSEHSG